MDQPTSMLRFVAMASLVWTSILGFVANTSLTWTNMLRLIDKIHHWQKLLCSDNKKIMTSSQMLRVKIMSPP